MRLAANHFTLTYLSRSSTSRLCRIRSLPARQALVISLMRYPKWTHTSARYSTRSTRSTSATTPSLYSPATTDRKRFGRGRVHLVDGVATTSRTWKVLCVHRSLFGGPTGFLLVE